MDAHPKTQLKPIKQHPKARANLISVIFFSWALPFFVKGYKKDLNEEDLYGPLKSHESRRLGDKLERAWLQEENAHRKPSLWRVLIKVFGKELALYGVCLAIIELGVKMSQPIFMAKLMEFYAPNQTTISKETAYLYAGGIVLMSLINVLMGHNYIFGLQHLGMKMRVALCSLIYRKALRLNKSALVDTTLGQMVNLLSNDVNRFDLSVIHTHNLWVTPIQTGIVMYLLYSTLGASPLIGIGVLLIFIPLQMYLGKRISGYRLRTALKTDVRVRLMNEIISGIQVIKMYTWEKPFSKLVDVARNLEIKQITGTSYIRAINISFTIFMNRLAIFFCVLLYVLTGNILQAQYVYTITSFYGMLRQSLTMFFPQGVATLAETNISVNRIQEFLKRKEVESNNKINKIFTLSMNGKKAPLEDPPLEKEVEVVMEKVCVKWDTKLPDYSLTDISLKINGNELVAFVGPVGSGKTTLLHVVLKELDILQGSLSVGGTISYASQQPWLFGSSIKQNILFGQKMDPKRYSQVVKVCALQRDFSLFPHGDLTIVGERGAMLSGGQKARINLARAIYKEADIYLLDDPLSAVDARVGKQLFDNCIAGYLKNKCVILVTHQLQYLRTVDRIYLLEKGHLVISGTYQELKSSNNEFLKLLESEPHDEKDEKMTSRKSTSSLNNVEEVEAPLDNKEERGTGNISKKVYASYFRAGGNCCAMFLMIVLFLLVQISASGLDYFLSFWVNLEQIKLQGNQTDPTTNQEFEGFFFTSDNCLYIYSALITIVVVVTLTRSLHFFNFCMRASRNLHNTMFMSIVYTSMRFFNLNSSGRILNRFSKDMGSIDEVLPNCIIDTIQIGMIALSINIVVGIVNAWILIPSVIIFGLFYIFRTIFLETSRDLKRMEGTTRSPVFTHMTASLEGLTTIRAFNAQEILKQEFDQHQDLHSSAFYMFLGCNRTFGFWLDLHCVFYIGLVTGSFLFIGKEMYGGNVGLGITQAISLTGMLQWGIRQWSELENQMTSVERVIEYRDIPSEPNPGTTKPGKDWPITANIEFRSVYLRYGSGETPVLKSLSFKIKSGEKVGIVGRTGAGKSSLITALFRLAEVEGEILIDGINVMEIPLGNLRSKISIIPQEPILFSGTLRYNLDPFNDFQDEDLWSALEEVEMRNACSALPSGLYSHVSEGGSNFSVGQRQLLCLARAVLRSNKILVMDEATANVDPQTDELIQATIRRKFIDCTVLTIAHRLHTVVDSDKVLVMDAGQVAEFDHPHVLLQNTEGIFYGLVRQTGKAMADSIMKSARENFKAPEK